MRVKTYNDIIYIRKESDANTHHGRLNIMSLKKQIIETMNYLFALLLCFAGCFIGAARYGFSASVSLDYALIMSLFMSLIISVYIRRDNKKEMKKAAKYAEYIEKKYGKKNMQMQKSKQQDIDNAINAIDKIDISHISANEDDDD